VALLRLDGLGRSLGLHRPGYLTRAEQIAGRPIPQSRQLPPPETARWHVEMTASPAIPAPAPAAVDPYRDLSAAADNADRLAASGTLPEAIAARLAQVAAAVRDVRHLTALPAGQAAPTLLHLASAVAALAADVREAVCLDQATRLVIHGQFLQDALTDSDLIA
jgi:hypothetical protein